jgi:starvation-inducible DNA-binding protein
MEQLQQELKELLASVVSFAIKIQNYHWNVTGPNFSQYHEFFGELYGEVNGSADGIAELLRTTGAFAPGSLSRFAELTRIDDELAIPEPTIMFTRLIRDNALILVFLYQVRRTAESLDQAGIVNFIEDRIATHEKHDWMLKASV